MNKGNAHSGHRSRMRQRYLVSGQDTFYDHELLELLLFYARPVVNTNNIAHALIDRFGSLGKALSADEESLREIQGIGSEGALFLKLFSDLSLRYLRTSHTNETLSTREELCRCFLSHISGDDPGIIHILCLGAGAELLKHISIPAADLIGKRITQKELAELLIKSEAVSIAAGISHGSGLPVPTEEDYSIARLLGELLSALGIGFRDIIICGGGKTFSMRGSGAFAF
ncbi:MAG: hypothetical protein IKH78_02085 [Ruminococcus sp.]|nr:hypothetical protein [Ruminococcus sp.]